jgi:predicted permease
MSIFLQDLKLAIRQLCRRPGFTLVAALTLAIGMGVNAVAFTVVNGLLFKGFIDSAMEDVGRVLTTPGGDEAGNASLEEYHRFRDATRDTLDLAAEGRLSLAWRHEGIAETAWVLFVSHDYFSMVRARPLAGRVEVAAAAGGSPTVLVGERFWRRKLNAASLAGLTLRLNDIDVSVAGVIPESFTGPGGLYSPDLWLPLDDLALFHTSATLQRRDERWLFVMGRLRPGVSVAAAQGHLDAATAAMAHDWPATHRDRGARFRLFSERNSEWRGLSTAAAIAMGIIGLVLLLACFNVANLLMARAVERERDMGVRAAVGASTLRLVRLVVTEGMLIAVVAGVAAVVLSWWTERLVSSFAIPIEEPQHIDLRPDASVIAFIAFLVSIAGVLPGLWPALAAAKIDLARVLGSQGGHTASGRPSPMRRWLVAAQVAGSTAFLAIAALLAQTYGNLALADVGFAKNSLVVAQFAPAAHGFDLDRSIRYAGMLLARVQALPGVAEAALADRVPFFIGFENVTAVSTAAAPCESHSCPKIATMAVGPGYFRTMGIALAEGREFDETSEHEVIINRPLADQLWSGGRGLGEALRIRDAGSPVTVVAVTARTHTRGLDRERPTLYVPLGRDYFERNLSLVARTTTPPETFVRPISEAARAVDPGVPLWSVKTMRQRMDVQLWPFRTVGWLFSICGLLALVLATVGLAGVVIHAVSRRLREFGVRLSVGARPRDLMSNVLKDTTRMLLPGLVAGTLLAATAARLLQVAFYGVDVLNPLTYLAVALLETLIVLMACIRPARRAASVDPLLALRSE